MFEFKYLNTQARESIRLAVLGRGLVWLATGGLLGLVVALPYDRLLGLPSSTGTILGALVWAGLLGSLHVRQVRTRS